MAEGYIYLIWEEQFLKTKENVFKIGKSTEIFSRIKSGYPKNSILLFAIYCKNIDEAEKQLLIIFNNKYRRYNIGGYKYSKERFIDNNYYSIINDIVCYLNLFNNNTDELSIVPHYKKEQLEIIENKQKEEKNKLKEEEKKLKEEEKKLKEEEKKLKEEEKKLKEEETKLKEEEEKKIKEEEKKSKKEKLKIKKLLGDMIMNHLKTIQRYQLYYIIDEFINNKIIKVENPYGVNQISLINVFKEWFHNYGNIKKAPKMSELIEAIIKKFGNKNAKSNKWHNIKIKEDNLVHLDDSDDLID